jgi:hypothetical protein
MLLSADPPPGDRPLRLQQPQPGQSAASSDDITEKQRQWMLAQRMVRDNLSREQYDSLASRYAQLNAAQVNVLTMVYEQRYGIACPYGHSAEEGGDSIQALREWIVAYRIVRDKLSVPKAKEFAEQLKSMSPSQIEALAQAYQQQAERDKHRASSQQPTGPEAANLREAQERMEFEMQRRQLGLNQASQFRSAQEAAQQSANSGANAAAAAATARFEEQQAFGQSMYQMRESRASWNGFYWPYW